MLTACFSCKEVAAVGEMYGTAGLPSLAPQLKASGPHPLSRVLSCGLDGDSDETFGCLYSGLAAVGIFTHAFDTYRAFLDKHAGHRVFMWNDEDDGQLPPDLRSAAQELPDLPEYLPPEPEQGYVRATLRFECSACHEEFQSDSPDWVKPFEPHLPDQKALQSFRRCMAQAAEMNVHETEPFGILFMDLDEWLGEHKAHKIRVALSIVDSSD